MNINWMDFIYVRMYLNLFCCPMSERTASKFMLASFQFHVYYFVSSREFVLLFLLLLLLHFIFNQHTFIRLFVYMFMRLYTLSDTHKLNCSHPYDVFRCICRQLAYRNVWLFEMPSNSHYKFMYISIELGTHHNGSENDFNQIGLR